MIIVMTNRALPVVSSNEPFDVLVNDMGVNLGVRQGQDDILYSGILSANNKVITFYPKGDESEIFLKSNGADKDKPWVFFVHGFHQDPDENIKKATQLSQHHDVNVIVFAWPSRPFDVDMSLDDVKEMVRDDVMSGTLGSITVAKIGINWLLKSLQDTWKNYQPARENAEKSIVDLLAAFDIVKDTLSITVPPVLLIHSMGNYLLKSTMDAIDELPMKFSNIILHQADVTSSNDSWIKKLKFSLKEDAKLYITTNAYDAVLASSQIHKRITGDVVTERLGQKRSNYLNDGINYLDFTDGVDISDDHEFFKRGEDDTHPDVFSCLGRILRAEDDQLPLHDRESNAGFTKMPTDTLLYRLEYVIHPADVDFDPDSDHPVPSLIFWGDTQSQSEKDATHD